MYNFLFMLIIKWETGEQKKNKNKKVDIIDFSFSIRMIVRNSEKYIWFCYFLYHILLSYLK